MYTYARLLSCIPPLFLEMIEKNRVTEAPVYRQRGIFSSESKHLGLL